MHKIYFTRFYRLAISFLILAAITTQFFTFRQSPINFFSYFTVLSNMLVSFVFISSALGILKSSHADRIRGAATLYMLITGLGFTILLGGKNDEFIGWVNFVLHYLTPIVIILDWILIPATKISFKESFVWIIFLLIYLAYALVRGITVSWYPYPFLNPSIVGYGGLLNYVLIVAVCSFILAWIITRLSGRNSSESL